MFAVLMVVQLGALGGALIARPDEGASAWPTLAFYAAMVAAFLLLSGVPEAWPTALRVVAAAATIPTVPAS